MIKFIFFLFLMLVSTFPSLTAQSPYQLQLKQELIYAGTGIGLTIFGAYLRGKSPIFTPDELTTFDPQDVNVFDRIATGLMVRRLALGKIYFQTLGLIMMYCDKVILLRNHYKIGYSYKVFGLCEVYG